ncbi:MAG: DUF4835 family protein [Bacteroidaceae bacterium]|nr:DUF4835 family protein [Bacteroidaceae bacterium]
MRKTSLITLIGLFSYITPISISAQELNAKVVINRAQVSDTKGDVFDALEKKITEFLNNHQWTEIKFRENEKIQCNFNITVNTYSDTDNSFTCTLLVSANRPVYGSSYNTVTYSNKDTEFNFIFQEFDQLEYRPETIDNNLVALLAYYAYIIIGFDMDTMSLKGGTPFLQTAEDIVTAAQSLGYPGWKAFDDSKNRFGILNDYMDGALEGLRVLNYKYHRQGLDQMAENPDEARKAIAEALESLDEAHKAKSLSSVPQLFTEYKRNELVSIFSGKDDNATRERIYDILFAIDASQNTEWQKIKK